MRGGLSAIGKLLALGIVVFVFFAGMAGVIFLSLQGSEIKVPEITGKNFIESEHELASLGLKIKKRADRVSADPPNTVLEQLPKPGETVKTGQMILVVTSKAPAEGETVPSTLKKATDEDDTEKIEEMISEKPKKPKANTNTNRKKADTTRDVEGSNTNSTSDSNTDSPGSDSNKKEPGSNNNSSEKSNKSTTTPSGKPSGTGNTSKPSSDTRPKTPNRP